MDSLNPVSVIHFYDTHRRGIACGVRGFEQRSTKHLRSVTCARCLGAVRERPTPRANEALDSAHP